MIGSKLIHSVLPALEKSIQGLVIPRNRSTHHAYVLTLLLEGSWQNYWWQLSVFVWKNLDSRNILTVPVCSAIIWDECGLNRAAVVFGIDVFWQTNGSIMSWECLLCDWPFVREIQYSLVESFKKDQKCRGLMREYFYTPSHWRGWGGGGIYWFQSVRPSSFCPSVHLSVSPTSRVCSVAPTVLVESIS